MQVKNKLYHIVLRKYASYLCCGSQAKRRLRRILVPYY